MIPKCRSIALQFVTARLQHAAEIAVAVAWFRENPRDDQNVRDFLHCKFTEE
jgi:hypothetical protein